MQEMTTRCIKETDRNVRCPLCQHLGVKNGKTKSGTQRYYCRRCSKYYISTYQNRAYTPEINNWIKDLIKEGCGIRSISRLLHISMTTVMKRILLIAKSILRPFVVIGKEHELDKLCTYLMKKRCLLWVIYALRKDTGEVVDFTVGSRSNSNEVLNKVVQTLLFSGSKRTDLRLTGRRM